MKINVIGCGYVGLTCAAFLAQHAHVVCSDSNKVLVDELNDHTFECVEPFILDIIYDKNIEFSTHYHNDQDIYLVCIGTPNNDGVPDISQLDEVIVRLRKHLTPRSVVILKSTVLPGTTSRFKQKLQMNCPVYFIPEFLSEGNAYQDYVFPEKIIVGTQGLEDNKILKQFLSLHETKNLVFTNYQTAEISKYANNTMLASRLATLNQIALVADSVGANMKTVEAVLAMDSRIGSKYLSSGLGFGGSCLEKDLQALKYLTPQNTDTLFQGILEANDYQAQFFAEKIDKKLKLYGVEEGRIIVSGLTFKNNTGDCRGSRAISLVNHLIELGYFVYLHDNILKEEGIRQKVFVTQTSRTAIIHKIEEALVYSCALIVCQTHNQHNPDIDLVNVHNMLEHPLLGDPNGLLDRKTVNDHELVYIGIGN